MNVLYARGPFCYHHPPLTEFPELHRELDSSYAINNLKLRINNGRKTRPDTLEVTQNTSPSLEKVTAQPSHGPCCRTPSLLTNYVSPSIDLIQSRLQVIHYPHQRFSLGFSGGCVHSARQVQNSSPLDTNIKLKYKKHVIIAASIIP